MASKKKAVAKAETFNEEQTQAVVKKVGSWTPQSVLQKVTDATLNVNKTFSDVSAQLQGVLKDYEEANTALSAKKQELETIYEKEQVLKDIDTLHADHNNTKTNLENELTVFQAGIENEKKERELQHEQEEQQFLFDREQKRQQDEEAYQGILREKRKAQQEQDDLRERAFQLREETLKKAEQELIELRAKVASFPEELKKEEGKQRGIAEFGIKREYEHKLQLLQKDFDTNTKIHANEVQALNARLLNSDKVIGDLQVQLNDAYKKIENISNKAVESAAATKSLADLQAMVQTQSNGQPRPKS